MLQRLKSLFEKFKWVHAILIMGLGAAFFFFTQDNSDLDAREQSIAAEKQSITSLEMKIKEAKEFEKQFEEKKRRYAELVKSLQSLKEALPRQFFLPDLLSDLLREAKQLEIEITLIRPDQIEQQGELYNSLGFKIESKGTFAQFFIFLDRMAHMGRLVNVESFTITKDNGHPEVALGGEEGAFAGTKLSGGRKMFTGISADVRILTYRYRGGGPGGGGGPAPAGAPGSPPAGGRR